MQTLYEQILPVFETKIIADELRTIITIKLAAVFKTISGMDLEPSDFICTDIYEINRPTFRFDFPYGVIFLHCHLKEKTLKVSFHFNCLHNSIVSSLPLKSRECDVELTQNMDFCNACFQQGTTFSKAIFDNTYSSHVFSNIYLDYSLFHDGTITKKIRYDNYIHYEHFKNLTEYGSNFDINDLSDHFVSFFLRFIKICSDHPHKFYEDFKEYTSYELVMDSINSFVTFCNLLYDQYTNDFERLNSRFIVIEMQVI